MTSGSDIAGPRWSRQCPSDVNAVGLTLMRVPVQTANRWAYKEWAVVCEALASGRQTVLLRKGGISEGPHGFEVEHREFWLFATRFHQTPEDLTEDGASLLDQVAAPRPGLVLLPAYARVDDVHWIDDECRLPHLAGLHVLSDRTVAERFHYRRPGLYALTARIYRPPRPLTIPDSPHFAGCRTWVDLPSELSTDGLTPVLGNADYQSQREKIARALGGPALT